MVKVGEIRQYSPRPLKAVQEYCPSMSSLRSQAIGHRSVSHCNATLVLVRAYKPPERPQNRLNIKESSQGRNPIYSQFNIKTTHRAVCYVQLPQ